MSYTFSFEKLNVWQDSKELVKLIYLITQKSPSEEKVSNKLNALRKAQLNK